jgi:hypothetical protein
MERRVQHVLQLLPVITLIAVAAAWSSCRRLPTSKTVTSVAAASGTQLRVYLQGYYDTSLLGLEVREKGKAPKYYWIAASSDANFGALKLRVELSGDKRRLWVSGTSRFVASIDAAYDDAAGRFYTKWGVAREASTTPDMELMHFESAPFPERTDSATVVFDAPVAE